MGSPLRQYGEEVSTLGDVVTELCLLQGNLKESNRPAQLVMAQKAWKELFRRTMWSVKRQVLEVDCETNTIQLPDDCERVVNISVMDRFRRLHPLTPNSDINTASISCSTTKCSCSKCNGKNTLCGGLDSVTYTTQNVNIKDATYIQKTWLRYDGNGGIEQDILMPIYDVSTDKVIFQHQISTICTLDVTEHGCIAVTRPNIEALTSYIGYGGGYGIDGLGNTTLTNQLAASVFDSAVASVFNYYGYWNYNAEDKSIIHIFRNNTGLREHFNVNTTEGSTNQAQHGNSINQVILSYQTNGETPGEEILIPEYSKRAVQAGVMYYQKYFNPRVPANEKMQYKQMWLAECTLVSKHLNPINMDTIAKLQSRKRPW